MNESIIQAAIKSADPMTAELAFKEMDAELSLLTDPNSRARLLLRKAELYGVIQRFVEARKEISLALKSAPGDPDIIFQCEHLGALLYHEEQDVAEAFKRMTALLLKYKKHMQSPESRPVYEDIQMRRGFELVQLGRFAEAVLIFEECLTFEMTPEDRSEVLAYLGICESHLKRYEKARDHFLQAREVGLVEQSQGLVHSQLGVVYFHLNLLRESKGELQRCELLPNESKFSMKKVYGWLSAVCRRLGEKAEADSYARLANPS